MAGKLKEVAAYPRLHRGLRNVSSSVSMLQAGAVAVEIDETAMNPELV